MKAAHMKKARPVKRQELSTTDQLVGREIHDISIEYANNVTLYVIRFIDGARIKVRYDGLYNGDGNLIEYKAAE